MKSLQRNRSCPQTCAVCGEVATGHHYQTPACNGCKNFYRRAIIGMKMFRSCPNKGACLLVEDNVALKQCRACRFFRCVESGMDPLCIVSEIPPEQNPIVQEVLRRRRYLQCSSEPSTRQQQPLMVLESGPKPVEMVINRLIDELSFLERAHDKIRRSRFSPAPEDGIPLAELIRGHSKFACDYGTFDILQTFSTVVKKRSPCLGEYSKVWPHADIVYAIEYLKTFEVFHRLRDDEKLLLVRSVASICAHFTISYFSYKMKSSVTYHPDGNTVTTRCVAHCKQFHVPWDSQQRKEFHYENIERIRVLEMDEKEYVLLKAIILSDSTLEGLSDSSRTILEEQRCCYAKALFSYMNTTKGPHRGPWRFLEMLKLLDWFRSVNERRKEHHLLRAAMGRRPWYCAEGPSDKPLLQDEIFI